MGNMGMDTLLVVLSYYYYYGYADIDKNRLFGNGRMDFGYKATPQTRQQHIFMMRGVGHTKNWGPQLWPFSHK